MNAHDPIIADILAQPLSKPQRHRPRGQLRVWMEDNALQIADILRSRTMADVARVCRAYGFKNANGQDVSVADLQRTWQRVKHGK